MTSSKRRKTAALALAFVGVAGLSIASAAQLNLGTSSLGAGTTVVASCQTTGKIEVGFTNAFEAGQYIASHVVLTDIDSACEGLNYKVTLTNDLGEVLGNESEGEIGATGTETIKLDQTVSAAAITGVAVVIYS